MHEAVSSKYMHNREAGSTSTGASVIVISYSSLLNSMEARHDLAVPLQKKRPTSNEEDRPRSRKPLRKNKTAQGKQETGQRNRSRNERHHSWE